MCQEQERYERVCEEAKRRPGTPGWLVTRWSVGTVAVMARWISRRVLAAGDLGGGDL